ncbi:hypothetical protein [Bordetella sp. LUAb4]|uniref:hypothetical protein n=1 Tax=Bordetella sp. LUAb4 TaxID=2843195 RepID=UPI001E3885A2|nr:hypothetical protein [Bordetella sp. LUAb4]
MVNELFVRQSANFLSLIERYQAGKVGLNSLVQKVEDLRLIVDDRSGWGDAVFQVVINLEQINAVAAIVRRELREDEAKFVDQQLRNLELLEN